MERGFGVVANLLTKKRNRSQISGSRNLNLSLTNLKLSVEKFFLEYQT